MPATGRKPRIGLLWRGGRTVPDPLALNPRMRPIFTALQDEGIEPAIVPYGEEFEDEVRSRLLALDGALIWVDPLTDGKTRKRLDALLRDVAGAGVWISAHPEVILKMGTKEVLFQTRSLGWGADTHLYRTLEEFVREFPARIAEAKTRVLKQYRGNGGLGVWRVALRDRDTVSIVQGRNGSVPEDMTFAAFAKRCEPYFGDGGRLIDQAYQPRIEEGMIRCYSVQDRVVGFARQTHEAPDPVNEASLVLFGLPSAKTMFSADEPQFGALRHRMEKEWIPGLQSMLDIPTPALPAIWDADFLFGPKTDAGDDTYVLCEINVSAVLPIPPDAPVRIAQAVATRFR